MYPRAPALQFQIVTLLLLQIIFLYDWGRGNLGPSLARFREARLACPNRRACSQATIKGP